MRTFNIKETYVEKDDPWSGILEAEEFVIFSTTNRLNVCSPGKVVFGRDMIIQKQHKVDWELIRHRNQTQINEDNVHKNIKIYDHNYKFGDKFMLGNHAAYK